MGGGERYGDENDDYYAEFRGLVRGADRGDRVTVWFEGYKKGKGEVRSESFRYRVARDTGNDVLIIANEDYTGVNPTYPAGTNAPKYVRAHRRAIRQAGYSADVWDVDRRGVPHDLGVLDHYDAVLWYLGDNRLTQDPEDETDHRRRSASCPTSRWPSASSTSRCGCGTTSTTAAS